MSRFVGIDLGTTYSVVAFINANGKPEVIPNENGQPITPSVVYFGTGTPIVGDEAKEHQETGATEVASFFKRSMGDSQFLLSFNIRLPGRTDCRECLSTLPENFTILPVKDYPSPESRPTIEPNIIDLHHFEFLELN